MPKGYYQEKQELERLRTGNPAQSEKERQYLAQIERASLPEPEVRRSPTADVLLRGQWLERTDPPIVFESKVIDPAFN